MRILVTGGSGFVGGALSNALAAQAYVHVRKTVRHAKHRTGKADADVVVADLSPQADWSKALAGMEVVVHTAARVHVINDHATNPLDEFRTVNVEGTLNLARQAAITGVRRFIFLSSIKVNGEATYPGFPFTCQAVTAPEDAYGISKAEAEAGLQHLAQQTGMEVVIIRPPLVYGPGVKGNFSSLLGWVARGLPLPLGAVTNNRRSLVGLDNLVDLILTCIDHPKAANQTFLVSDGEDLSTTDLLQRIGKAMNRSVHLIPVPVRILHIASSLLGKRAIAERLLGSLQVDISKTCTLLDWKPHVSVDEGLRRAAQQRL
jgi:nucleoside-diphosphate-sugar epimerase